MRALDSEKRFYTIKEFHSLLSGVITQNQVYKMVKRGEIPSRKIGTRIVLSADWVNSYINAPCVALEKVNKTDV